jgi:AcrR family transcriptional regulator
VVVAAACNGAAHGFEVFVPRHRRVSDVQIVRVARRVFLEHGTQVPVSVVAKELGVSAATLFVRMGTKNKLISAAFWPPDPPVLKMLEERLPDDSPVDEQLIDILVAVADFVAAEIPATFTLYAAGLRPKSPDDFADATPRRLRRALTKWLRAAARSARVERDPRVAAEALIGTLEARSLHAFLGKQPLKERDTRRFVRSLVATVLGARAPGSDSLGAAVQKPRA